MIELKKFAFLVMFAFLALPMVSSLVEEGDISVAGFELEKIIALIGAWLCVFLFVLAFFGYKRNGRKRLFYVSLAFLLFAIKNFMVASELFVPEVEWFDPVAIFLELGALVSFFFGAIKK